MILSIFNSVDKISSKLPVIFSFNSKSNLFFSGKIMAGILILSELAFFF